MIDPDRKDLTDFLAGQPRGAKALVERYASPLINHASYMLGGDRAMAEDVVQNTFLKLWQNASKLVEADQALQLRAWLFRVLRNQCLDEIKRNKYILDGDDAFDDLADEKPGAEQNLQNQEQARFVMKLVNRLPERQKSALLMAHFEGMKNAEIARAMDCSVEAVENLLSRARRSMRAWSNEEDSRWMMN